MRLRLYSSTSGDRATPNLVAVQRADLDFLPTRLVCPLRVGVRATGLRSSVEWGGRHYVVLCDLVRPINANFLVQVGELDEATSSDILEKIQSLLEA